jgi:cell division initiation protein
MELTPLDIRNQEFKKKNWGGYDPEEVRAFLSQLGMAFENKQRELIDTRDKLRVCREQLNHFKLIENTLQEAAITMQRIIDEKKEEAHKEAEFILAHSRANALKEADAIRKESDELRFEVQNLRSQRRNFFLRMKSVVNAQRELISALEQDDKDFLELEDVDMTLKRDHLSSGFSDDDRD